MNKHYRFLVLILSSCLLILTISCHKKRTVNTSFYYWKTVYKSNATEDSYLQHMHARKLYVRIMDINSNENSVEPIPISPIEFKNKLPDTVGIVPVVFIVNDFLKNISQQQRFCIRRLFVNRNAHVVNHVDDIFDLLRIDDFAR